jgi:hypothetical protein
MGVHRPRPSGRAGFDKLLEVRVVEGHDVAAASMCSVSAPINEQGPI